MFVTGMMADILNMVSKIEFQNFKDNIIKDDLKEMEIKDDIKNMKNGVMKDLKSLFMLNSPSQEEGKESNRVES